MSRSHFTDYDAAVTERCERALLTLLGDLGPWRERIYLAGGLAPRYLVGATPASGPHVGTTDVDLIIGLALEDENPETYRTLYNNLRGAKFEEGDSSFQWRRTVDGATVLVEFLCGTEAVAPGRIYKPKDEYMGSRLGAFNVRGAQLARHDFIECTIEGERLDGGGRSQVVVRVANLLPYVVLKILAFQDRHENKDSYDLVFTILNFGDGARSAGMAAARSAVIDHPQVDEAIGLLEQRYADTGHDGPSAYADFLENGDADKHARDRQQAVATVRAFVRGFREARGQ